MVGAHANRVCGALQVVLPRGECGQNGQQLLLMHRVACLGTHHLLRHERHRLQAVAMILLQHRADCIAGRVAVHHELLAEIRQHQHRCGLQCALELNERQLLLGPPQQVQLLPCSVARQLGERKGEGAEAAHESAVVPCKSKERTQLPQIRRNRPVAHRLDLVLHDSQPVLPHHVTEELDLSLAQRTLAGLGVQSLLTQARQCLSYMLLVLLQRVAVHDDVVEEHQDEPVEEVREGVVHQLHEDARRVAQAHRQHVVLEQPLRRGEGRLVPIRLADEDLIEARAQVDLGEVLRLGQLVEQLIGARERVLVLERHSIERSEVGDCPILAGRGRLRLLHVEVRGSKLRLTLRDEALCQHVFEPLGLKRGVLLVDPRWNTRRWLGAGRQLDVQLVSTSRRQARRQAVGKHVAKLLEQLVPHLHQLGGLGRLLHCAAPHRRQDTPAIVVRHGQVCDGVPSVRTAEHLMERASLLPLLPLAGL